MCCFVAVKRLGTHKAMKKLSQAMARYRIPPVGGNFCRRPQRKTAQAQSRMRYRQRWRICDPHTLGPEENIEIEAARPPSCAAPFAPEMLFDHVQPLKHLRR